MPIIDMLPGQSRGWRRWAFGAASVVVHAGILAALVVATDESGEAAAEPVEEGVTYVDISRFAPPPPPPPSSAPEAETSEPQPTQPQQPEPTPQPRQREPQPEAPPRAADLLEPEDSIPDEPLGADVPVAPPVTDPAPQVAPVTGSQAGGRPGGEPGGVEGGEEGGKVGGVVGGEGEEVPPGGTYVAAVVDRRAELTNRSELARILQRLYPNALQDAGQEGRVVVQFVVGTNGRVDMGSVKIMSSTHGGFEEPTREALREFRFRPARMGDKTVRMLTQMPIVWEVR